MIKLACSERLVLVDSGCKKNPAISGASLSFYTTFLNGATRKPGINAWNN